MKSKAALLSACVFSVALPLFLASCAGQVAAAGGGGAAGFSNPVMVGADPHVCVVGKDVWLYSTNGSGQFYVFVSNDLRKWERRGPVLRFKDVAWVEEGRKNRGAWAPGVIERGGRWYFYYSVGPKPSRIGVAVGDGPAGPFRDSGRPLLSDEGKRGFEAIDPMVFADPKTGKHYLYAGGSAGSKLRIFELNDDLVSFAREIKTKTPPKFTEGAFMHFRKGIYYLSYSHGSYKTSSYSVHYATSETPVGPWTYRGEILASDATRKGPGHHSFFTSPLDGAELIAYHRYENQTGDGPYKVPRQIAFERIRYTDDGLIEPIFMTGAGRE
ncbi:MAG: family 43 glycosylhydrolase [Opitutaceae bacterium]|jgi:beta-xylosidase|nr:family 43 glycosylhydrolase [Opitutaceae bacterium]